MKEDLRQEYTKKIREKRIEQQELKENLEKLKWLLNEPKVLEYLNLLKKVRDKIFVANDDLVATVVEEDFYIPRDKCAHDVWYYNGKCAKKPGSKYTYVSNFPLKNIYHQYFCLECEKDQKLLTEEENAEFIKTHMIVDANRDALEVHDIKIRYFELLETYPTDEAYLILKNQLEEEKLSR